MFVSSEKIRLVVVCCSPIGMQNRRCCCSFSPKNLRFFFFASHAQKYRYVVVIFNIISI